MTGESLKKFEKEIINLDERLNKTKKILITAPSSADGDSVGSQLALRQMLLNRSSDYSIKIINDAPLAERYLFLPDIKYVWSYENYLKEHKDTSFELGIIVDGGIDRVEKVRKFFENCNTKVFIDHHIISADYEYDIKIIEPIASSTTELVYYLSQTNLFNMPLKKDFAEFIYLGLIFDTGFFRYSSTTPEVLELGAKLIKTGFDFTRVGERGMLERTFTGLKLLSNTLARARLASNGKIIWSTLPQRTMQRFNAEEDDREGIIDSLFLTHGIEVAVLFFELDQTKTKVSLRSQGKIDVAHFARSLTVHGGGHKKAAGANFDLPIKKAISYVIPKLEAEINAL